MTFSPRIPQREAIHGDGNQPGIYATWKAGDRSAAVILPTGVGKTGLYLYLAFRAWKQGRRVLVIAHREELLIQPLNGLKKWFPECVKDAGIVKGARNDVKARIVFASIQTLQRRDEVRIGQLLEHGAFDLVIYDEGHHSVAEGAQRVLTTLDEAAVAEKGKTPLKLCLTATPERGDDLELGSYWKLSYSYPIQRAWKEGYLVPRWFADEDIGGRAVVERLPSEPDFESMTPEEQKKYFHRFDGLNDEEIGAALVTAGIVDHTAAMMREHCVGPNEHTIGPSDRLKSVVFTASVEQARLTAEALKDDGWKAAFISGETAKGERRRILRGLERGALDVVCNCGVLTEGFDDPTILAVVLARPLSSPGLYRQCVGRGARTCKDLGNGVAKTEFLELDLAGASLEHSLTQANVLLTNEERVKSERAGMAPEEALNDVLGSMVRTRKKFDGFEWHEIQGFTHRVRAVDCGARGGTLVFIGYRQHRGWRALRVHGDEVTDLSPGYLVSDQWSSDIAADLARRAVKVSRSVRESRQGFPKKPSLNDRKKLSAKQIPGRTEMNRTEAKSAIRVYADIDLLCDLGILRSKKRRSWHVAK